MQDSLLQVHVFPFHAAQFSHSDSSAERQKQPQFKICSASGQPAKSDFLLLSWLKSFISYPLSLGRKNPEVLPDRFLFFPRAYDTL